MPELPEVQTIRSQLSNYLPLHIHEVRCTPLLKKNILHTDLKINQKHIIQIRRKGKVLIFEFHDKSFLLSHLGMTGTWLAGKTIETTRHTHLIIKTNKIILAYDDPRRFGHLYYLNENKMNEKLNDLGIDLLDPKFSIEYLTKSLKRFPEKHLKETLLDQKLFAGSGNYIANEVCARAGIRPTRKCKRITKKEMEEILKSFREVLTPAINSGGTTFQGGYRDTSGEKGKGVQNLVVFYQKICQLCRVTEVKKIYLKGRGTYYCPKCQK